MKDKLIVSVIALALSLPHVFAQTGKMGSDHPDIHKIIVKEVLQASSYTYIHADENGSLLWIAIPRMEAEVGESYYYKGGLNMGEFKSKELDRTFSSILFLNGLVSPELVEGGSPDSDSLTKQSKALEKNENIQIDPADGGITIAELFSRREKYANQIVKIRGKVSKYNSGIMKRNWIHLQDGSAPEEKLDFTATSNEVVKVGDIITIEGIISLDKDFGAGYFYSLIMENGRIIE